MGGVDPMSGHSWEHCMPVDYYMRFDDDYWAPPAPASEMIVLEEFQVDHHVDDSIFSEPCVPDVPHLRASKKAKKSAQKKAMKVAKAMMAKNPLHRKRKN